jgi:hypothetical protein
MEEKVDGRKKKEDLTEKRGMMWGVVCGENKSCKQGGMYANICLEGLRFPTTHSLYNVEGSAVYGIKGSTARTEGMSCSIGAEIKTGQRKKPTTARNRAVSTKPKFRVERKKMVAGENI